MTRYEAAILPKEYRLPVSSDWVEYGPTPPKPAHGRPRTDYSQFMMEYTPYPINDDQVDPIPFHQTGEFPFPYNHQIDGVDEQEFNQFSPYRLQHDRQNEPSVIRRRGSANRKKFVHFRESRDITYYPELYQAEKMYPEDEQQSPPAVFSPAHAGSSTPETVTFRGMTEHAHQSDNTMVTFDRNQPDGSGRTGSDHWNYQGDHMNQTVCFDSQGDSLQLPSPLEEKRNAEITAPSSQEKMATRKGEWKPRQGNRDTNQETPMFRGESPLSVRACDSGVTLPSNVVKVSAIGPVYLINRNSAKRSSGTFISLIGRLPVDRSEGKDVKVFHRTVAKEAVAHVRKRGKRLEETSFETQEFNREVKADAGYIVQEEGDIEMKEYKNTFSTPDTHSNRSSGTRFRQQFEDLYNEAEATLKASGPEVRNPTRIKRDSNEHIVYHKKKDELCDDSEFRPEVRESPSATTQKLYKQNESAKQADASGGPRSPIGISSDLDTKLAPPVKSARHKPEKPSDNSEGFHRKNVKNLSVNIMGVSSESLDATEQSPYYERHSSANSPYNKTTIIHKDPVDPDMSLVCGEGPAVVVGKDYTSSYIVIVAIDFGTMFSGYAFSFTRDPESIHMMRKWEGGDPGINNQKAPTSILITPNGEFDSFGYAARDRYHDLDAEEAKDYLYFEKFKMALHHNADLSKDTMLEASNGKSILAITVFSYALRFFKEHALQELSDQSGVKIVNDDVRWVITVPAIWKAPAKQFMRQAAYQAGIASSLNPEQLIISLEPEAASVYCRKLRLYQLIPESPVVHPLTSPNKKSPEILNMDLACSYLTHGMRYMVVDCGGGTVDITVHEMEKDGLLRELYKATGGAYGGTGVDMEFEKLLIALFGKKFIDQFKAERPVGWMDLMIAFESRKRSASPYKNTPLNISLPFAFIDYYKKIKKCHVESAIKKYNDKNVRWSTQGMLRLSPEVMQSLFQPTLLRIRESIGNVLNDPDAKDLKYLFLVGGFAESPMLQDFVRQEFGDILKVIIPQGVGLSILKGAVLYGQDPSVVSIRRCRMTYGVGVLNKYDENKHPKEKLFTKDGMNWCSDVFDKFVVINQPLKAGDTVVRSYTPAKIDQKLSIINIYASDKEDVQFITDPSVRKCGNLSLDLSTENPITPTRREIQTIMSFGDTEIRMTALDVLTGKSVKSTIDFLD